MSEMPTAPADPFDDPAESGFFGKEAKRRLKGSLLAVEVFEFLPDKKTKVSRDGKLNPTIIGTVHVLDGTDKGEVFENSDIYGKVMTDQLKKSIGRMVVGRLNHGAAKPGFEDNLPWVLDRATPEERAAAVAWNTARQAAARAADPFAA